MVLFSWKQFQNIESFLDTQLKANIQAKRNV